MPIEFSTAWTLIFNFVGWPIIQLGWSAIISNLPAEWFGDPRFRSWEANGNFYRHALAIGKWKRWLPDAGNWFGVKFSKKALASADCDYLQRFVSEARRGEVCHWCAIASTPIFFLWNPLWADVVMLAFGLVSNVPCIASLRYARLRLNRVLNHANRHTVACLQIRRLRAL